jgi:hypothetical protein
MTSQTLQLGFVKALMSCPGISDDGDFNVGIVEAARDVAIVIMRTRDRGSDVERTHLMLERSKIAHLLKDKEREVLDITIATPGAQDKRSWSLRNVRRVLFCRTRDPDESGLWKVVLEGSSGPLALLDQDTLDSALMTMVQWRRPKLPLM